MTTKDEKQELQSKTLILDEVEGIDDILDKVNQGNGTKKRKTSAKSDDVDDLLSRIENGESTSSSNKIIPIAIGIVLIFLIIYVLFIK